MTIAPIIRSVCVKAPPPRAFDLFTSQMGLGKGWLGIVESYAQMADAV